MLGDRYVKTMDEFLWYRSAEAAYFMGLDNEIGCIKPQKKANFAILEDDPLADKLVEVWLKYRLKHIPVWGCVFEGGLTQLPPLLVSVV